jgi:hypothetical protein
MINSFLLAAVLLGVTGAAASTDGNGIALMMTTAKGAPDALIKVFNSSYFGFCHSNWSFELARLSKETSRKHAVLFALLFFILLRASNHMGGKT